MEDKFKKFLEDAFRSISPTQAAMELRKQTLRDMMARAQELRIKGMTDEDLIFDTVLEDYEDLGAKLKEFEKQEVIVRSAKRNLLLGFVVSVAVVVILSLTYVLIGALTHVWHPTWLIMVGGIFLGLAVIFAIVSVKAIAKKRFFVLRLLVALTEVLLAVFVFLLLQIVFALPQAWMTFLAMVALILGADTVIAFFTNSKSKWFELPVFVEVFSVMLYIALGILTSGFWHPGWLLCLVGALFALAELICFIAIRNSKKDKKEKKKLADKFVKEDEKYWTEW